MGLGIIISNFASDQAKSKPQLILIFIIIVVLLILYSQRLLGITNNYYTTIVTCLMIIVISIIILSTFLNVLQISDNQHIQNFGNVFNSPGSKNFFAVFLLLLSVIFIYELPVYDNNNPHTITDKVLFGHNGILSNRTFGLLLIFSFCISTGYMIHSTTREVNE